MGSPQVTLTPMSDNATPLILLTRPRVQAERFADACRAEFGARADIMVAPLLRIVILEALPELDPRTDLIFTSENGVRAYSAMGGAAGRTAYCVGDRTAEAARNSGLEALSAAGTVAELRALIVGTAPGRPLIHIHGKSVRGDLAGDLTKAGFRATSLTAYDQQELPMNDAASEAIASPRHIILPLFSPRSAAILARQMPPPKNTVFTCISEATRAALPVELHPCAPISDAPNGKAMLTAVARQLCT